MLHTIDLSNENFLKGKQYETTIRWFGTTHHDTTSKHFVRWLRREATTSGENFR